MKNSISKDWANLDGGKAKRIMRNWVARWVAVGFGMLRKEVMA